MSKEEIIRKVCGRIEVPQRLVANEKPEKEKPV